MAGIDVLATGVGSVELIAGALIVVGLETRLAAIVLNLDMLVAIISAKIPILLGHGYWIFVRESATYYSLCGLLHEWRNDYAMLLGSLFLVIVGVELVAGYVCV